MRIIDGAAQDLRYALRRWRRQPGVTAVALLSLALGVGANTAAFSAIDVLMVRSLPVTDPARLVVVQREFRGYGTADTTTYPAFERLRDAGIFESVAAISAVERFGVRVDRAAASDTRSSRIELVSGNYFATLGLRATLGRLLDPSDDDRARAPVTVLSVPAWHRWFGGSPDVVGRAFTLNGTTFTIVGVAQAGYAGEDIGDVTDAWVPIAFQAHVMPERADLLGNSGSNWIRVLARLKPSMAVRQAEAAVVAVFATLPASTSPFGTPKIGLGPAGRGFSPQRESLRTPLLVLAIVASLVLLLACANVTMLGLARADERRTELGVRLALGAERSRLVRQWMTEGLVLGVGSGAAGFAVAVWITRVLSTIAASGRASFDLNLAPDGRMLSLAAGVSFVTAVVSSVWPAYRASRMSATALGPARGAAPIRRSRMLIVIQVAASFAMLVAGGLFVRTLHNLETQDIGVARDHVWMFWMAPAEAGRTGTTLAPLFATAQERAVAIPGVASASPSSDGVLSGFVGLRTVSVDGRVPTPGEDVNAQWNLVGARFFETLGMPLVAGRDFTAGDTAGAPPVAVVNQTMAKRFFGEANPIGRTFGFGRDLSRQVEIIGVVRDAKYFSARDDAEPMVFLPYQQDVDHIFRMCVVVRTSSDSRGLIDRIRGELASIDPAVPVRLVTSTTEQLDRSLSQERLTAGLAGGFGVLALILASIGLYGVAAFNVARRTREIGIRMAIGEPRRSILQRVLNDNLILVVGGFAIGGPVGVIGMQGVRALLFGVTPVDALTLCGAAGVLFAVAIAATIVPARRAAAVDPVVALRAD